MQHRSKITRPVRALMKAAGYDEWQIKQAAKGKTARQRLALAIVEPDPERDADSHDSSASREAVLT